MTIDKPIKERMKKLLPPILIWDIEVDSITWLMQLLICRVKANDVWTVAMYIIPK